MFATSCGRWLGCCGMTFFCSCYSVLSLSEQTSLYSDLCNTLHRTLLINNAVFSLVDLAINSFFQSSVRLHYNLELISKCCPCDLCYVNLFKFFSFTCKSIAWCASNMIIIILLPPESFSQWLIHARSTYQLYSRWYLGP